LLLVGGAIVDGILSVITLNFFEDFIDSLDSLGFLGISYLSGMILFEMTWIIIKSLVWLNIIKKRDKSRNNTNEKNKAYNFV